MKPLIPTFGRSSLHSSSQPVSACGLLSGVVMRPQLRRHLSVVLIVLVTATCVSSPNPNAITPQRIPDAVETIVLTPVSLPDELAEHAASMEQFDSLITWLLEQTRFDCIPASEYAAIWERILDRTEGLFDSLTGERNEEQFDLARRQLFRRLNTLYRADAILYPEIWVVNAPFADGVARWDGASQALVGLGTRLVHALGAALSGSDSNLPSGAVEALSLVVFVEDMQGEELYAHSGGIQVLEKVGGSPRDRTAVPEEEWFADRARNRKAVELALDPIVSEAQEER
jgi:hypothetical protein